MRPTRAGMWVAVLAGGLVVAGRALGYQDELYAAGAALALLLAVSWLWLRFRSLEVSVLRSIRPSRIHAGATATIEVTVRNLGTRPSPVLRLRDPVSGTKGADLLLGPQDAARTSTVAYRLPATGRGIVTVGPMSLELVDAFGLVRNLHRAAPEAELIVLPAVVDIPPLPRSTGPDPHGGASASTIGRSGDDFAALRDYAVGDDLRKVHWPSSARRGDLLVRQDDQPQQGRVTVLLDVRRSTNDEDQLERGVSIAASILRAHRRRGDHIRLATSDGYDSGFGVGSAHLDTIMDFLAVVERGGRGGLDRAIEVIGRRDHGAVVLVSGRPVAADIDAIERATRRSRVRCVVRLDQAGLGTTPGGTEVLGVVEAAAFRQLWTTAVTGSARRRLRPDHARSQAGAR